MKYSTIIIDHFQHPRNNGELAHATHVGEATNEACLDRLRFLLLVKHDKIEACNFQAQGCVPTIAAGSVVAEFLCGKPRAILEEISEQTVAELLGGLPRTKKHVALLVVEALRNLHEVHRDDA
ncbi:MAG: iron-sulfur cluster assembly scaffold protein [Candidatus Sumerlaeaceae bacterium]